MSDCIVNEAQPSWLSLIENEGEYSSCFSRNSKGLQSKTNNIMNFKAKNQDKLPVKGLRAGDRFLSSIIYSSPLNFLRFWLV